MVLKGNNNNNNANDLYTTDFRRKGQATAQLNIVDVLRLEIGINIYVLK